MPEMERGLTPETMRFLDLWLGRPLCALLTLLRVVGDALSPRRAEQPIRRVLIIKLIEQGATVLACDAINRAIEMVGRENVFFWVFSDNRPILDLLELVPPENVFEHRTGSPMALLADGIRIILQARRAGIDCVIDLEFFARAPAILSYLTGARRRVGMHRFTAEGPYRGDLMTHRVQYNPYVSAAAAYLMLVEAAAANPEEIPMLKQPPIRPAPPPRFMPSQADLTDARAKLEQAARRALTAPIVLLNPNTSDIIPLRRWPLERFVELGQRLLADYREAAVVITGGPAEEQSGIEMARAIGSDRAFSLAGQTTLRELLALYCLADVLVTNDSGPAHFASLTGIETVCLFGPETPALYGPIGDHSHVIWAGLACSPCVTAFNHRLSPCSDNVCMQAITVEQVYEKVRDLLDVRTGGREA